MVSETVMEERRATKLRRCLVGTGQQARMGVWIRTRRSLAGAVVDLDPALLVVVWLLPPVLVTAATRRDALDSSRRYSSWSALRVAASKDGRTRL